MKKLIVTLFALLIVLGAAIGPVTANDTPDTIVAFFHGGEIFPPGSGCDAALPSGLAIGDYIDWTPLYNFCHAGQVFSPSREPLGTIFIAHYVESMGAVPDQISVGCIFMFEFDGDRLYGYVTGTRMDLNQGGLNLTYQGEIIGGTGAYEGAAGEVVGQGTPFLGGPVLKFILQLN